MPRKRCRHCGKMWERKPYDDPFRVWCSVDCAVEISRDKQERARRKDLRQRRSALKTRSELAKEAQQAFNLYIRTRDFELPCISCKRPNDGQHQRHASHYRSVGAASQLRYCTANVHASCQTCNRHLSGNILEYRINLIEKIGLEKVEEMENNNEVRKYDPEYLRRLKTIFARRARHLKKLRGYQ